MSDNRKPGPSSQNSRGSARSRGGHTRASAHGHRYEPYSNPTSDRHDHHHTGGGDLRLQQNDPQWVCRHPLGFHHDRGCEQCALQRRHITDAIRTDPELASRIAQASLDDPETLRVEVEDARRNWSLCQDDLDDCERELDRTHREIERVREELDQERRLRQRPPAPAMLPQVHDRGRNLSAPQQTIELLQQQLREATTARDNYRLHTEELATQLLRLGHSVVAASGSDASTTLPRPFFSISDPVPGGAPTYVIPRQDTDVEMGDASEAAPVPYATRTFVLGTDGTLVRQRADIFDMSSDEGETIESDESEDFDDDGDIGRPKAPKKAKGKVVASRPPLPQQQAPPVLPVTRPSRRPPTGPRVDRHNWTAPQPSWDSNPLPADRARWGDESSLARGSDIGPVPWTHTPATVGWGDPSRPMYQQGWSGVGHIGLPPPPPPSSHFSERGGRNQPPPLPPRLVTRNQPIWHTEFNGVAWVARRIPREPIVANLHGQERYEHERTRGVNAPRPALQPGELPPGFVAANVTTSEVLRNLMERASEPTNPGARDAVDILGDLRNVAGRAPHPRHELEDIVMNEYIGKPAWAGGKAHLKQNKKG
ncbi:hypothetical protein QCA50_008797 [Cerrena zonata]|uniref:Uncharacterized protein n=1 Tax=Cerrena zonata TaxID=2478898 RepID=A0AAW0G9V3_9APHY